ncbi:potassium channel subfamily K member 17 [Pangasianodon hypophthalmus]|uniref:potassium channel subfamily K member 17 n=1 Tax=Pangasianodon hypophthalmus TaxID=310915 RepID=UPI0023071C12|nr:potassium channel subfamily K member 17 [Pangasianodon hypophthalmus]
MASIRSGKLFKRFSFVKFFSLLLLGAGYLTYVLIGGIVFWKLEGDQVTSDIAQLEVKKRKLLQVYPCLGQSGLEELGEFMLEISKNGMSLKNNHTAGGFWKFTSSAVFAATVVTTIGYGNISPSTMPGQMFCVIFAIFGIPLNMVVLNQVGKYMLAIERNFCTSIAKKTSHQKCVLVSLHFASFIGSAALYLVVPMLFFHAYEGWTYAQGIYYCFITLSTVGFGDFVADYNPNKDYPDWYGCILGVWIFFGMAWLALLINHTIDLLGHLDAYLKSGKNSGKTNKSQDQELPETQQKDPEEEKTDDVCE